MSMSGAGGCGHGGHSGLGVSAAMGHADQTAGYDPTAPAGKRKPPTQTSNPLIVIAISFGLFATLISLPWVLDTIQNNEIES